MPTLNAQAPVSVVMPEPLANALRERAVAEDRSVSSLIRRAVRDMLSTTGEGAGQGASATTTDVVASAYDC